MSFEEVLNVICEYYEIEVERVLENKSRVSLIVIAKQFVIFFMTTRYKMSIVELQRKMNYKSHASVINLLKKARFYIKNERRFKDDYCEISYLLNKHNVPSICVRFGI
jgi:chromosomal replication initiation ATPase DnaA